MIEFAGIADTTALPSKDRSAVYDDFFGLGIVYIAFIGNEFLVSNLVKNGGDLQQFFMKYNPCLMYIFLVVLLLIFCCVRISDKTQIFFNWLRLFALFMIVSNVVFIAYCISLYEFIHDPVLERKFGAYAMYFSSLATAIIFYFKTHLYRGRSVRAFVNCIILGVLSGVLMCVFRQAT
ncbi:hypothetical protein K9F62_07745 [Desulfovibrio sp. JY]|nr:hypothetical protein K9F62_07745 [Desulfovibrio sp. JY]